MSKLILTPESKELAEILMRLDIPMMKTVITPHTLGWLNRNIGIRNVGKPSYPRAMELITKLLRENK